jgi:hypothetical protein
MQYFMGIDPDMHTLPIAVVDQAGKLVHVHVARNDKKLTGREALISMSKVLAFTSAISEIAALTVEGQEIYQFGAGKTKNPKSIMFLATVAGMCLNRFMVPDTYFPTPQEWKGNVPKQIHQARILGRMGLEYQTKGAQNDGWCLPSVKIEGIKDSDWKHAVDAIGLAQWGREKYQRDKKAKERLG